jgi:hypothetical protein
MKRVLVVALVLLTITVIAGVSLIVGRIIYKQRKQDNQKSDSGSTHDEPVVFPFNQKHVNTNRFGFPHFYHSNGVIHLPFDDIHEPFEVWYAGDYNMSRIDYYYGKLERKGGEYSNKENLKSCNVNEFFEFLESVNISLEATANFPFDC